MKRALVLAGGGAKIGWASGAMQVLMDEAELRFDHIDATSGSVFNLGMLLSGKTATEIAEAWGDIAPKEFVSYHPFWKYITFWRLPSLLTQEAARKHILPKWGIDLEKIRSCRRVYDHPCTATFNILDFGTKRIKTIPSTEMDIDYFLAVDAVPGVVPPIEKDGTLYTDAMLLKDANLTEAIRRGADEIWVLWTVDDRLEWRGGFWNHFGHIFETCAVGNLKRELDMIEKINLRTHDGRADADQRHVTVYLLRPEVPVPVDYLFFRNKKQMRSAIESGREWARKYLEGRGFLPPGKSDGGGKGIQFTETMSGFWTPGEHRHEPGYEGGRNAAQDLEFTLTITIDDLERFLADPNHTATAEGAVRGSYFGGNCHIDRGTFTLSNKDQNGTHQMHYDLLFHALDNQYRLSGLKTVRDGAGADPWRDTTTLSTEILIEGANRPIGAGLLRMTPAEYLRQLMTFRAVGCESQQECVDTLRKFGQVFMGGLWSAYGPRYLPQLPS